MPKLYLVLTRYIPIYLKQFVFLQNVHTIIFLSRWMTGLILCTVSADADRKTRFMQALFGKIFQKGSTTIFNDTACIIYELTVSDLQWHRLQSYLAPFITNPLHYKFNFIGLILCGLSIPFASKNTYFCLQFISEAWRKAVFIPSAKIAA